MARKPIDTVQLKLRFSEALRRRLEREAKRQERSLNAEIISRLQQSFRKSENAELAAYAWRAALGEEAGDLSREFAGVLWRIEQATGKGWYRKNQALVELRPRGYGFSPINPVLRFLLDAHRGIAHNPAADQALAEAEKLTESAALERLGLASSDEVAAKPNRKGGESK